MKKIIYLLLIVVSFVACNKDENPPAPATPAITNTTTTSNPTSSSNKFYVGVLANYGTGAIANDTWEVVPTVVLEGDTLNYISYGMNPNIPSGIVDAVFEYDIPSTTTINCNDSIDFVLFFNTDSLNAGDVIQEIQIYHVPYLNMVPEWVGPNSWYNITWTTPSVINFNYFNVNVRCQ